MTGPAAIPCPYCKREARQVTGREVYPRRPDLWPKRFYLCRPCDAYCGTHPDGEPLGMPANRELRRARNFVHALFDPVWENVAEAYGEDNKRLRGIARARAYRWLAERMGIPDAESHVAMFNLERCRQAYRILKREQPTAVVVRAWAKARKAQDIARGATAA